MPAMVANMMNPVSPAPRSEPGRHHGYGQRDLGERHDLHVHDAVAYHLGVAREGPKQSIGEEKNMRPMAAMRKTARRFASYADSRASAGLP